MIGVTWSVVLWLGLLALSSSAQLHQLLHADAQTFSHECLLTSIAKDGTVELSPGLRAPAPPFVEGDLAPAPRAFDFPVRDLRLAFGRGPPLFFIVSS
jgi:hypothetical protein